MDDDPLISRVYIVLLSLVFIGASAGTKASAKEVPKIPTQEPTATASPVPTSTPSPTASPAPTSTPTPPPTQTPTPTLDPVVEITAASIVDNVLFWRGQIERINEAEGLDLDPVLVMAIMAIESGGIQSAVSYAGALGLMQVIPRDWYEMSEDHIRSSPISNIHQGMYILRWSLDLAEKEGLSLEHGISFYNCSYDGVMNDRCGAKGGLVYADGVLNFWYPRFVLALEELK